MNRIYRVDTVIFDCDSTLSYLEGIDELAVRKGVYEQLAPLTEQAMQGQLKLDQVFKRRLELTLPTQSDLKWLGERYIETLVDGARQVIESLQSAGKQVHVVSGGLQPAVLRLATSLGINPQNVHAVDIFFDPLGNYCGFDERSPLSKSGGKKLVCAEIISTGLNAVMIGDGITDLEARQERVEVIGFGGVAIRHAVKSSVADYIEERSLLPILDRILVNPKTSD